VGGGCLGNGLTISCWYYPNNQQKRYLHREKNILETYFNLKI